MKTTINFTGTSIMDCSLNDLKNILHESLNRIDDYQQMASDLNSEDDVIEYINNSYNDVECVYLHLMNGGEVSVSERNSVRMCIKETEKFVAVNLFF